MEIDLELSDEEYVVGRARGLLKENPVVAKAWMVTAKTLYPNNFGIQFEAYLIEKKSGNVLEAARSFSQIITKFQNNSELWKEIEKVTLALRTETDECDPEKKFLCDMFRHLSSEVQHQLLLFTADHCEDTMEHCRLLLLLLQRFPTAISSNGPRLVDTLISAEKHSPEGNFAVNVYRRLLVCDLLPLLAKEQIKVDLPSKLLYKLLHKAIEFYMYYIGFGNSPIPETQPKIEDPWTKLFGVVQFIGHHLQWDPHLVDFGPSWSKEGYWQKILKFSQSKSKSYPMEEKQLLICSSLFFLYCLYQYRNSMNPESRPGDTNSKYLMVEAFTDPNLPYTTPDPKSKKRRADGEVGYSQSPCLTIDKQEMKYIHCNFLCCINCWDLINSSDHLRREFVKFYSHLKVDQILSEFGIDYALYKGLYDEAFMCLQKVTDPTIILQKYLRLASVLYMRNNYTSCFEFILSALPMLPTIEVGTICDNLIIGGNQRHLHYLPMTRMAILQYVVKILMRCIKENMKKHSYSELAIGHIFVLSQLDWPQEEDIIPPLLEQIKQHSNFKYYNFQNYIINVELLEEITYLGTSQGGQIQLDLLPHLGQRRIGTRGADKGVKEEIKQTIRRQIARSNERLDELIINFILNERSQILQTLI